MAWTKLKYYTVHVTLFRKTNRSARKSIIVYALKYVFVHKDANGNKDNEECFTLRWSVLIGF